MSLQSASVIRFGKELRLIRLPWLVVVILFVAAGIWGEIDSYEWVEGHRHRHWIGYSPLQTAVLVLGSVFIAAHAFGSEFQSRTYSLLQAQPVGRATFLCDKFIAVAAALLVIFIAHQFWLLPIERIASNPRMEYLEYSNFPGDSYLFGLCALAGTPFWATIARSTSGTFLYSLASAFAFWVGLGAGPSVVRLLFSESLSRWNGDGLLEGGSAAYCALFLVLGWTRFLSLETLDPARTGRETSAEGGTASAAETEASSSRATLSSVLRPGRSRFLNLVAKEVCLQQGNFLLCLVFLGCVAGVALLRPLDPPLAFWRASLLLPFVVYIPVCAVMTGCASLTEERRLGMHASNLVLPLAPGVQFTTKLATSAAIFGLIGLALPAALFFFHAEPALGPQSEIFQAARNPGVYAVLAWIFLIAFWASTIPGTVGPALVAAAGLVTGVIMLSPATKQFWAGESQDFVQAFSARFDGLLAIQCGLICATGYRQFRATRVRPIETAVMFAAIVFLPMGIRLAILGLSYLMTA